MRSERGLISSGLAKIVLTLIIVAVFLLETTSVLVAKVQADGISVAAAEAAVTVYDTTRSSTKAKQAAVAKAAESGAIVTGFRVLLAQGIIRVTIRRTAKTLFIHKIGFMKDLTFADSTHDGHLSQ